MKDKLRRALTRFGELLYPPRCAVCGEIFPAAELEYTGVCRKCLAELSIPEAGYIETRLAPEVTCVSAVYYEGAMRGALLAYKFHGGRSRAKGFSRLMDAAATAAGLEFDMIAYVPVSRKRLRERGYDQARLLADRFASLRGTRAEPALVKTRDVGKQSLLSDPAERERNVRDVYSQGRVSVAGRRVLLIDDVVTTGSTLRSAAGALLGAGAIRVTCLALAKAGKG